MPKIGKRVVCGLDEVMLIFCPIKVLSKVDLPTLGQPTIATVPQRKPSDARGVFTESK